VVVSRAVNGYLRMRRAIREAIDADTERHDIARWHDASHCNKHGGGLAVGEPAALALESVRRISH
jgi:hypothetical protein